MNVYKYHNIVEPSYVTSPKQKQKNGLQRSVVKFISENYLKESPAFVSEEPLHRISSNFYVVIDSLHDEWCVIALDGRI